MQKLNWIKGNPKLQDLLLDGNWRKSSYFEVCCKSEFWGCAFFISIEKGVTNNINDAIVYILERMVIEGEDWDEKLQSNINADGFNAVLSTGYISDLKGQLVSTADFWKNFEEIINGITNSPNFQITKDGVKLEKADFIQEQEICSVICLINEWNDRQFFLETDKQWAFFSWGTGA